MPSTIKDVSRLTGLSTATVSKYINGARIKPDNRAKIEEAIRTLRFQANPIARGLKTRRSMSVGVLVHNFENLFAMTVVSHIERKLRDAGYSTLLCDYSEDPALEGERLLFLLSKQVDGLIALPQTLDAADYQPVLDARMPLVLIDRIVPGMDCDSVTIDNCRGAQTATAYLLSLGHARIGLIAGPQALYTVSERRRGYVEAFAAAGRTPDPRIISHGDYTIQSGFERALAMMALPEPPTALFATNYETTLGALMAANSLGLRLPDELSIIGFDSLQLTGIFRPELTLVAQPVAQIGQTAADLLLRRLRGDAQGAPDARVLPTKLVLAGTAARARA